MSWIKTFVLLFLTGLFCYGLLVVGDWLIAKTLSHSVATHKAYNEAKEIEQQRMISEDMPQREQAVSEGYSPVLYPYLTDFLELQYPLVAGQPLTDTYFCNEGYGLVKYRSDRFGFRNQDQIWDLSPRHIMIGDSFVHGACVEDQDTLPQQLSQQLDEPVLNLGYGANHPGHYYAYAGLFIPKIKPKMVYLLFYSNDNGSFKKSALEQKYLIEKQPFFSSQNLALFDLKVFQKEAQKVLSRLNMPQKKVDQGRQRSFITRILHAFMNHVLLPNILKLLSHQVSGFDMTARTIKHTHHLCTLHLCKVIVGLIPNNEFLQPDTRTNDYGKQLTQLTSDLGIQFIDGRKFLDRTKGSADYAIKGHHLSPQGYQKFAQMLARITSGHLAH